MDRAAFLSRIDRTDVDGCWPWTGGLDANGYGLVYWEGRCRTAHAVAWELANGETLARRGEPGHLEVDHVAARGCIDRACCRPDHLEAVTKEENRRRRMQDACVHGHEFTPENTRWYQGHRYCRTCQRIGRRKHAAKKKEAA